MSQLRTSVTSILDTLRVIGDGDINEFFLEKSGFEKSSRPGDGAESTWFLARPAVWVDLGRNDPKTNIGASFNGNELSRFELASIVIGAALTELGDRP